MFFSEKSNRKPAKLFLLLMSLGIAGCTQAEWNQYWDNYKIPTGYHYNLEKKAEAPPETLATHEDRGAVETYTFSEPAVSYEAEALSAPTSSDPGFWLGASEDILGRLLSRMGTPAEAIYLTPVDPAHPLNAPFAAALQQALAARGLAVSAVPGMGPFGMRYGVQEMPAHGASQLKLDLALISGQQVVVQETWFYPLVRRGMATGPTYNPPGAPEPGSQPLSLIRPY